ncbi:MAG: hypothetical protein ACFFCS_00110 [Candidatus Hodarchaeota archaeon]
MVNFPIDEFRTVFRPHYAGTELEELFDDMCELIEGISDPWKVLNKLNLRFYDFDAEEFDLDDWLINAGLVILVIKSRIISGENVNSSEINRLCTWFQDNLKASKSDLLDDEIHYFYSFYILSEFLKLYVEDSVDEARAEKLKSFIRQNFDEIMVLPSFVKVKAFSTIVPYFLDLLKLFPEDLLPLIGDLNFILKELKEDEGQLDDSLGLCARTLAFKDYQTPSPEYQFVWAYEAMKKIKDPFIKLSTMINIAVGSSLKNEKDYCEKLLSDAYMLSFKLPTPKKEIHIAFLMRGAIESRLDNSKIARDVSTAFYEIMENNIKKIQKIAGVMEDPPDDPDFDAEDLMDELEISFIILSALIDNLGLASMHTSDITYIKQVEKVMKKVFEVNLVITFKTKLLLYLLNFDDNKDFIGVSHQYIKDISEILTAELENIFVDDLYDFFIDLSKNCLEASQITGDFFFLKKLEEILVLIQVKKELDETEYSTFLYQILSGCHDLVGKMWNDEFNCNLLQGFTIQGL